MYQLQAYRDRCIETAVHNCIKQKQLQTTGAYNSVKTSIFNCAKPSAK